MIELSNFTDGESTLLGPIVRRATLLSIAIYAIILHPSPTMITILVSVFILDTLCLFHYWQLHEKTDWKWSPLGSTAQILGSLLPKEEYKESRKLCVTDSTDNGTNNLKNH